MDTYLKVQDLLEDTIDDETVILDVKNKKIYFVNETAYFIWKNCNNTNIQEICKRLMNSIDDEHKNTIHKEKIEDDVKKTIKQLLDSNLVIKIKDD